MFYHLNGSEQGQFQVVSPNRYRSKWSLAQHEDIEDGIQLWDSRGGILTSILLYSVKRLRTLNPDFLP